jgi:DNA cross-link repair 1A protein
VVGVPYSEHSSWPELRACVAALRPKRLIPTVNAGSKAQSGALVERFVDLMDLSSHRGRLDSFLLRRPSSGSLGRQQECVQQQQQEEDTAQQQQREQQVDPEKQHLQQDGWQPSAPAVQGRSSNSTGSNPRCSCSPQSSIVCAQGGGQAHLQQATAELQQTRLTGSTQAVDVSSSCGQAGEQQQQQQAVIEQQVYLGDVDIAEQQRLLDEAARVLRLKRSWAAAKAAAQASAKPRKASGRRRCA